MRRALQGLLIAMSLFTAACAPMVTQSPGAGYSPVNAVKDGDDARVILKGADVVAYFTDHKYEQGSPAIKSVYKEVTFRFASAEHKRMFDATPEKYLPQFGGYCTNGIAYAIPWGGDADIFEMWDGKLYVFGGQGSHDAFMLDQPRFMKLAHQYWDTEVNGSNAFWQRTKRLIFRVPHYKSGEELAKEVAAAKAAGKLK